MYAGSSEGSVLAILASVQARVQAVRQREARIAEDPAAAGGDSASLDLVHEADGLLEEARSCPCAQGWWLHRSIM